MLSKVNLVCSFFIDTSYNKYQSGFHDFAYHLCYHVKIMLFVIIIINIIIYDHYEHKRDPLGPSPYGNLKNVTECTKILSFAKKL